MQCLPDSLAGTEYYTPTSEGHEAALGERLAWLRDLHAQAMAPHEHAATPHERHNDAHTPNTQRNAGN